MSETSFWEGGPKNMFFMGLFLGVAVIAIAGLIYVLTVGSPGRAKTADTANNNVVVQQPDAQQPAPSYAPVKDVGPTDHVRGNKNAKVTLIEYSDFECPYCKRHVPTIEQALKDYPNDVRFVYRHYPLPFHANAQKEAEASECVAKQGGDNAFWKFHDIVYAETTATGTGIPLDTLGDIAKRSGVDQKKFQTCLDSGEMAARVSADMASGNDSGVEGTPATFVNGTLVSGAVPYSVLKEAIEAAKK
ncbi:MAG: DsbA family protein [bacterium]|nr:DsbA family protein [bacterium]